MNMMDVFDDEDELGGPFFSDQDIIEVLQEVLQDNSASSSMVSICSMSSDDRFNGSIDHSTSSNNSCASESKVIKKHSKFGHHPKGKRIDSPTPPKSPKLLIPDIPKTDVRTRYGQIYLNMLNGHDLLALPDYVNRYFTPHCTQTRGIRVFNPMTKTINLHNLASFTSRDIVTFSMGSNFETTPDCIVTCQKELIRPIRDTKNVEITLKVHFEGCRFFQINDAFSDELSRCITNHEITAQDALKKLKTLEYKVSLEQPVTFLTDGILTLCINEEGHIYHLGFAISSSNKPGQEWTGEEQITLKFAQQNRNMTTPRQLHHQQQQSSIDDDQL